MEIYSNSSLLIRHRGENVFFSNDFCRKSGFLLSPPSARKSHPEHNDWRRWRKIEFRWSFRLLGNCMGFLDLMFSTKDYFQFLPQKHDTTRWMRGEIDGLWSERKTKMLPGKNWFWEIRYTPLCAQQAIYWLNCHVRIEEIPCTTSILWCYDYMAIMTPLFKKLLCVTRVALCKQNITIQMNPLHRQVQQFISISKLIYKEGGFAAYLHTQQQIQ